MFAARPHSPALYLFVLAAAGVLLWWAWYRHQQRVKHARLVAAQAGLTLDVGPKDPPSTPFALMNTGRAKRVRFHMWRGPDASVFEYEYTTGSGKSSRKWRYTCAMVELPFGSPHLRIGPEGFWSNLGEVFGIRDIEIESAQFNERYRVSCDDDRFAVTLLGHEMIAWMVSPSSGGGTIRFEFLGDQLLCVSERVPLDHLPAMLEWSTQIRQHLPRVLADLYPVKR